MKIIEGEPILYRGVIWIVKGYQHPREGVVAYPRYDAVNRRRLSSWEAYGLARSKASYWDCIKQEVPVIEGESYIWRPGSDTVSRRLQELLSILRDHLGEERVFPTGSVLIGDARDIDIVIRGDPGSAIDVLRSLREKNILGRPGPGILWREYLSKHSHTLSFTEYLSLKKRTLLHNVYRGVPVSIRITMYRDGFRGCRDRVRDRRPTGPIRINVLDALNPYTTPARYKCWTRRYGSVLLETHRMVYAELDRGDYIFNGYIEHREDGVFLVPDHGYLKPLPRSHEL